MTPQDTRDLLIGFSIIFLAVRNIVDELRQGDIRRRISRIERRIGI